MEEWLPRILIRVFLRREKYYPKRKILSLISYYSRTMLSRRIFETDFARALQDELARQNMSIRELAERAEIPPATLYKLTSGKADPRLSTVRRIVGVLESRPQPSTSSRRGRPIHASPPSGGSSASSSPGRRASSR